MRKTILLADDSPTIQRLVAQTFAGADFDIVSVSNGDAAIRKFEEVRPSLVLADIYMPGKNGYEVCAYVKNHPALKSTPVILLIGAFEAFSEMDAVRVAADANIKKPFEPQALIGLVQSMLPEKPAEALEAKIQESDDLLGLESLFREEVETPKGAVRPTIAEDEVDWIADRVIQKLSVEVIENIAWDIVPDIAEKVVREQLKKIDES